MENRKQKPSVDLGSRMVRFFLAALVLGGALGLVAAMGIMAYLSLMHGVPEDAVRTAIVLAIFYGTAGAMLGATIGVMGAIFIFSHR
jgi:hypothetical protein